MGEEEGDPQRLKTTAAAAAAYDYDNDPRWAEYWSNILIPPHMAARSDIVDHFKRKFYQRFIVRISNRFTRFPSVTIAFGLANSHPPIRRSLMPKPRQRSCNGSPFLRSACLVSVALEID
ncbi:hypothetical protein GW17_00006831 [Ensete ventricosum]|nr:hypothetical protein GW17_00006831 [Ensete ventricosum]RZS01687.1 hypothetical protein BHM03_00031595 [Ensete ventricosum]